MSGILISFDYSRRVAINAEPISADVFEARFLLTPDGDPKLSQDYGFLRVTLSGDAQKIPDLSLSDLEEWLKEAVVTMLQSKPAPAND